MSGIEAYSKNLQREREESLYSKLFRQNISIFNLTGGLIALSQLKKVRSGLSFNKDKNKTLSRIYEIEKRNKSLKQGYKEMASLNLTLVQMCFEADNEALSVCEEKLTECE